MDNWLLYRINETGRAVSTERLKPMLRSELRRYAEGRLAGCRGVEVWDGAICILRLHREDPSGDAR